MAALVLTSVAVSTGHGHARHDVFLKHVDNTMSAAQTAKHYEIIIAVSHLPPYRFCASKRLRPNQFPWDGCSLDNTLHGFRRLTTDSAQWPAAILYRAEMPDAVKESLRITAGDVALHATTRHQSNSSCVTASITGSWTCAADDICASTSRPAIILCPQVHEAKCRQ